MTRRTPRRDNETEKRTMARTNKSPVVVRLSKTLADKLVDVLMAGKDDKLANAVCR